jgi:UDP-N-acetylglucosamine diphosphorylase / glucose-1-phosphate thymidylyltransferase / UDP-N-acetylgalactosamine diphosphorylase / glucosamine-1-phosphate N-acetyltransferase / galactosamine-1-phosphate N-acetyltransferase
MTTLHPSYFFNLSTFEHAALFKDCLYPWEALDRLDSYLESFPLLGEIRGSVSPHAYLVSPHLIFIGEGSVVEPGAYIQGPCILGKNCTVRHGAYIRGTFVAGDGCVIGHDTEIKKTIFFNQTHAAHFAYLGDSILGHQVNLGAGTKCANLKLDGAPITIHYEDKRLSTGLRKMGAIIGDRTQLGCNSVTNPGTLLGQDVRCYPCINIGGFVPSRSIAKPQHSFILTSY